MHPVTLLYIVGRWSLESGKKSISTHRHEEALTRMASRAAGRIIPAKKPPLVQDKEPKVGVTRT